MGKAPTPLPHTMMNLVKAGGFDTSDAACKKALSKVGLEPDQFGTYNDVNSSQHDKRKELQQRARNEKPGRKAPKKPKHVTPCAGGTVCSCHTSQKARDKSDAGEFWHANSQAGHLSQDAIQREPGARGDPCQNYPPGGSGKGAHGGTYGYDVNRAPCMDHAGMSSQKGSPHYHVCRTEDDFARQTLGKPVSQNDMQEGVARSAAACVTNAGWETDPRTGKLRSVEPTDKAAKAVQSQFRKDQVAQASGGSAKAAGAGVGKAAPSTAKGLTKEQKHAIACIVAQWKKGVAAMQQDSINKYGPGSKSANERAAKAYNKENGTNKKWSELTDKQKDQAVAARQRELEKKGINKNPFEGTTKEKRAMCREYQANWLYQSSGGAKAQPPPDRTFLPMQGFGGSISAPSGGTSGGGGKKSK